MTTVARALALASALAGAALLAPTPHQHALAHSDGHGGDGHGAGHGVGAGGGAFAAGEPGDPRKAHRVIEITMGEGPGTMAYSPDRIEVRKGEQVRFVLRNAGELAHELVIDSVENNARHKIAMEKAPGMQHEDPNARRIEPKQADEILWRFSKAGNFEIACLIPGHYEAGMKGIVIVR
jgi:uncharacterized cupredoxin-like copper-binding protein